MPNSFTGNNIHIAGYGKKAWSFKKKEIPAFFTTYFYKWKNAWWWWHKKGMLPYANKGWYEHRTKMIKMFIMFDNLYANHETYQIKKDNEQFKNEMKHAKTKKKR